METSTRSSWLRAFVSLAGVMFPGFLMGASEGASAESDRCVSAVISSMVWPAGYTEVQWSSGRSNVTLVANADLSAIPFAWSGTASVSGTAFPVMVTSLGSDAMTPSVVTSLTASGEVRANGTPVHWPRGLPAPGASLQAAILAGDPNPDDLAAMEALLEDFETHRAKYLAEEAARAAAQAAAPPPRVIKPAGLPRFLRMEVVSEEKAAALRATPGFGIEAPVP